MDDRWAEDEADGSEDDAARKQAKRPKAATDVSRKGEETNAAGADAHESTAGLDGLTSGLDGLINPRSGKGKSGSAAHPSSGKVRCSCS